MNVHRLQLRTLPERLAICRLDPDEPVPEWAASGEFFAVTRTANELSVVCPEADVPEGINAERGRRALYVFVDGAIDFGIVGVIAALTVPLAHAGIPVFVISTFDTDYLLINDSELTRAVEVLVRSGHGVSD